MLAFVSKICRLKTPHFSTDFGHLLVDESLGRGKTLKMAIALRRCFSLRNLLLLRSRSNVSLPSLSHLSSLSPASETNFLQNLRDSNRLFLDSFVREPRRGFAKGRKSSESLVDPCVCMYLYILNLYFLC